MKPGDLRRWKYPDEMPSSFRRQGIFMIINVREKSALQTVDLLANGEIKKSWNLEWVHKHSEALDETR